MNKYIYKKYNSIFPKLFKREEIRLRRFLKGQYTITHVGSTAIPGIGGKGIIDILIGITGDIEEYKKWLIESGYEFRQKASTNDRLFFRIDHIDSGEGIRRYHVHLTRGNSKDFREILLFKDLLIQNSKIAKEYDKLKKLAFEKAKGIGEIYRKIKEPFPKKILRG